MYSKNNQDSWYIYEENGEIHGYTIMDNGSFNEFLNYEEFDLNVFNWNCENDR